jgi:hypothetical protein
MARAGSEPTPRRLQFFGGPKDGESMAAMRGTPALAVLPAACVDGFYVWHARSSRYEWLQVPPAPPAP